MVTFKRILALTLTLCFIVVLAPNTQATYNLSLTGAVDFQTDPWVAEAFQGYIVVSLGNTTQGSLDITLSASGEIAPWLSWTEPSTFTIYPDQQIWVHYEIDFPASAPDEYTGQITASGVPTPTGQTGGAAVGGNMALSIGVSINIPARVYFQNVYADEIGAVSEVFNGNNYSFEGNVTYELTDSDTELENHTIAISNLTTNQSIITSVNWNSTVELGVTYDVIFTLTGLNNSMVDQKSISFRLPTPADIIGTWHSPTVVYADDDATIYALVHDHQNGLTECEVHYTIDGGTEQTGAMDFDAGNGYYMFLIDNTSYQAGSYIEYWVTSFNDASGIAYTGQSSTRNFRVYSSTAPDLIIDETSLSFSPIDPQVDVMYDSNTSNIFITVRNAGRGDVADVIVEMFDYNNSVSRETVASIAAGDSTIVRFYWATPEAGTHLLRFVVDPDDVYAETNENNNYISIEVDVEVAPELPPVEPPEEPTSLLPYIIIPIILFLIFFFLFFFKKKTINVTISEVKPFKHPKKGTMLWRYTCSYDDGIILGPTQSSEMHAEVGTVIEVKPNGLYARDNGTIGWDNAEVLKVLEDGKPDQEKDIRKLIKKEK